MHLHGAFEPSVMGKLDVRVASADMGDDHGVFAFERAEQRVGREDRIGRGPTLDENV